jgi:hypothetical protein
MALALLLLLALTLGLAAGWRLAVARTAKRPTRAVAIEQRVDGWLLCEAALAQEVPLALARVRSRVPAPLRLAHERRFAERP